MRELKKTKNLKIQLENKQNNENLIIIYENIIIMNIIEFHLRIMKIMNILEFYMRIMKIIKIIEFLKRITKIIKILEFH